MTHCAIADAGEAMRQIRRYAWRFGLLRAWDRWDRLGDAPTRCCLFTVSAGGASLDG